MKNREISGKRICIISEVNHCITFIWFNQKSSQTRKSSSEIDKYLRFIYDFLNEYGSWPNIGNGSCFVYLLSSLSQSFRWWFSILANLLSNPVFYVFFVIQKYPKYGIDLNWSTLYKNAISLKEENGHHSFGSKFV